MIELNHQYISSRNGSSDVSLRDNGGSFKSVANLTRTAVFFLLLGACGNLLAIISAWRKYEATQSMRQDSLMDLMSVKIIFPHNHLSIGLWIVELTAFVLFVLWLHVAHSNLKIIQNQPTVFKPSWVFISFILPFINLFAPFQVMQEVWQKSLPSSCNASTKILVITWWGMCLLMAVSGVAFWWFMDYSQQEALFTTSCDVVYHVAWIIVTVLTIMIISKVSTFQSLRFGSLAETQH